MYWKNWAGNVTANPKQRIPIWTTPGLAHAVDHALDTNRRVKAVGAGHSFTGIAVTDDVQLDLTNYTGITDFDQATGRITLRAGTGLWQIPGLLADSGWAMENLGDINHQSLAGAISTGTHGTGTAFGGLASQVVGIEMLTGTGDTIVATDAAPELLHALRVSLGALGIISTVTLQLVPEYDLHTIEEPASLDAVLTNWQELNATFDHFEFFWFGHDTNVQTKRSQRQPVQLPVTTPTRHARLDEALTDGALEALCRMGMLRPTRVPTLNRFATRAWGSRDITAHWSHAFTSSRRVRFTEMEYAVPYDDVPAILTELRGLFTRRGIGSTFPLEIRAAAPEPTWLATNHEQPTGYIAVHQYHRQDHREYFQLVQAVLHAAGGRPHWGKLHTMNATALAARYPRWAEFQALRNTYDPNRAFTNPYLDRVLGE